MQNPHDMADANFLLADQLDEHPNLHATIKDAERFLLSNIDIVQRAPLQTYASALVFSPYESQIRKENLTPYPTWFKYGPVVEDHWGPVLQTLQGHGTEVAAVALSFDGRYLASLSSCCELLLWDTMTGTLHSTLMEGGWDSFIKMESKPHFRLAFSCNGQLASLSSASEVRVWDPATGVICRNMMHHERWEVVAIAFASDDTLAISYKGRPPQTWIYKAGALPILLETKLTACALSFLSEGTIALLCSDQDFSGVIGSEIVLHNPKTHAERRIPITEVGVTSFSSNKVALSHWNKDGVELLSLYDMRKESYQTFKCSASRVTALAFSSNNRGIFVGSLDGSVQLCNLDSGTGTVIWTGSSSIDSIASAPDGRLAIATRLTQEIRILELRSDSLPFNGDSPHGSAFTIQEQAWRRMQTSLPRISTLHGPIDSIAFSLDGRQLVYVSAEGTHILDSATRRELCLYRSQHVQAVTTSGIYVACGQVTGAVRVWHPASRQLLKTLKGSLEIVAAVAFSPNNRILLAADRYGRAVDIWDTRTWSLQHTLEAVDENSAEPDSTGDLQSIAFSQNGKHIAFLYRKLLSIWDAEQSCCLQSIEIIFPWNDSQRNQISVFAEDSYIDTTFGRVYLDQPPDDNGLWKVEDARWRVYDNWLYRDGKRLLWLPPDFRPKCTAIHDDLFVMGHESGKVTFFEGNDNDSAPESASQVFAPESGDTSSSKAQAYYKRSYEADPRSHDSRKRIK